MGKNKLLGIISWFLCLMLCLVLLFSLNRGLTATFWVTVASVAVAFISGLIFQLEVWKKVETLDGKFLHIPALTFSMLYMAAQIPVSIIFALCSQLLSYKTAILANAVLLIIAWLLVLGSMVGNGYIGKVNSRQEDHHVEL